MCNGMYQDFDVKRRLAVDQTVACLIYLWRASSDFRMAMVGLGDEFAMNE